MSTHQLWCDRTRIVATRTSNVVKVINEPPQVNLCGRHKEAAAGALDKVSKKAFDNSTHWRYTASNPFYTRKTFSVVCPRTAAHSELTMSP